MTIPAGMIEDLLSARDLWMSRVELAKTCQIGKGGGWHTKATELVAVLEKRELTSEWDESLPALFRETVDSLLDDIHDLCAEIAELAVERLGED